MADNNNFSHFDEEVQLGQQDIQSQGIEQSAQEATDNIKDKVSSKGQEVLRKQLGIDTKLNSIQAQAKDRLGDAAKKGAKAVGKKAATAGKQVGKQVGKAATRAAAQVGKQLAAAAVKAAIPFAGWIVGGIAVLGVVSYGAALVIDNEASRTNEANYQHKNVEDVNRVSKNGVDLTDEKNVYFNPQTKRYELGKGRMPTQANKLYYVYYAVMSQQSRWFVEMERTGTRPGDPDAGTEKNPYWKPVKREGDYSKYTLDGYLFNNNVIDKVNLRPVNPDKPLTLENLVDEKAASSINKLSLNTNLLYLLNSTLNGEMFGTGKGEMFFAEQFVKPVNHDSDYNFESLTETRDMTDAEKAKYKAKAHGAEDDGKQEQDFQQKYERWGNTLDTQNEARGGSSTASEQDYGNAGSSDGISNPILKKAFEWGLSQLDKGITYSMANRNGPSSYDCSSFVTRALTEAGMEGVDGLTTVSMLTNSNALGQSGVKFKQVDYKTAKKGTIIVVGGLAGGGANGHTFFLAEDFHGDDTKVLECNAGTNGIAAHQTFVTQSMNYNEVVALEPVGDGVSNTSDAKKGSKAKNKKHNTSGNYTEKAENKYKDQISTGKLTAKSRQFDTNYRPEVVKDLYRIDEIAKPIWKKGDFYISSESGPISAIPSELNLKKYIEVTHNSQFVIGAGAVAGKDGSAQGTDKDKSILSSSYWEDRDEITKWSFEHGYNPAFIISLIKVMTDDGNKELAGSKYNFLDDKSLIQNPNENPQSETDKEKPAEPETNPDEKKEEDDQTWRNYGSEYYNYSIPIKNVRDGLDQLDRKLSENNEGKDWNWEVAKGMGIKRRDFNKINKYFSKSGGVGDVRATFANQGLKEIKVYTFNGSGNEDSQALGVVTVDGKNDDTLIDGYKKYFTTNEFIKQADAVKPGTAKANHPYAIKRDGDGNVKTTTGIWDYGFGSIFKIAKEKYEAYEITIDEHGNYLLAKNDSTNWVSFLINGEVTSDTQYQVLGATTPFGSIDMSKEIVESQAAIEEVIEKMKRGEALSGADVALLDKHKEGTSLKVNGQTVTAGENNFFVSTKPKIDKDPQVVNVNGAQYLFDYLTNYETYIPSSTQSKLNVVDRWKAMNDANAGTQEATNKIMDIFNNLIGDGKSSKDSDDSSSSSSTGAGEGDLDQSPEAVKARKQAYDALVKGGMGSIGAIGIITNWVAESGVDPTSTFGEYTSKYVVSEIDRNTALNTDKPIGVGQWLGGRKTGLLQYAQQKGKEWSDLDLQIDYMLRGENAQIRAALPLVATAKDTKQAASRFFMGWEIHGGGASLADNDPHSDPLAISNNIEGHLSEKTSKALWKELVEPNGEVKPDLSKLENGGSELSDASSGSSTNSGGISNWGDGTGFNAIISNFLHDIRGTVVSLFGGGENWDPTMFATDPTLNERSLQQRKKGKTTNTYEGNQLYVNGADAYTWTKYGKKLSKENAQMVIKQFVASIESRENRPVYYDEVHDNFNDYELSRILEENYKLAFKDLFKSEKQKSANRIGDISSSPFKGVTLGDTTIVAGYGWMKEGDKVTLNPGYVLKGESNAEIVAVKSGKVVFSGSDPVFGNTVIVRSTNNTEQIAYAGLGSLNGLNVGDNVHAGDTLGRASSDGTMRLFGLTSKEDLSKGLPILPTDIDNTTNYFDLGFNFGISQQNREKILKEVNGYDPAKNTIKKPKASKMKPKEAKLSEFLTKESDSAGGGGAVDGQIDIQPNYAAANATTYPVGQCTWGVKALAPWVGNFWGNGGQWADSARREGYSVGETPKTGSVAVWNDGGYGHVAVVVGVKGNQIQVKESNYNGQQYINNFRGWFDPRYVQGHVSYIYPKN